MAASSGTAISSSTSSADATGDVAGTAGAVVMRFRSPNVLSTRPAHTSTSQPLGMAGELLV